MVWMTCCMVQAFLKLGVSLLPASSSCWIVVLGRYAYLCWLITTVPGSGITFSPECCPTQLVFPQSPSFLRQPVSRSKLDSVCHWVSVLGFLLLQWNTTTKATRGETDFSQLRLPHHSSSSKEFRTVTQNWKGTRSATDLPAARSHGGIFSIKVLSFGWLYLLIKN